ncbi:MAG: LPS export ABC transporter permease LptF [Rhodospirillaceae bacterium]
MSGITWYIFRQLIVGTSLVSIALAFLVWLTQSLQFLQFIVNKGLALGAWLKLTVLLLPWFLSVILPAALFFVVLFVYSKLSLDRELVVAQAAGMSRMRIATPALMCAAAAVIIGLIFTIYLVPASMRSFKELQWTIRTDVSQVLLRDGTFNQIGENLTVYVRGRDKNGDLVGVMVHDTRDKEVSMTLMAERGTLGGREGESNVVLYNGSRQELRRGTANLSILYFDSYTLDFRGVDSGGDDRYADIRERPTGELFNLSEADGISTANVVRMRAEGHQRIVGPLGAIAFTLVGLAFLLTGPFDRKGQTMRMVAAIGVVVGLQAAALGVMSLASKNNSYIPALYAVALLPIPVGLYILLSPQWRRPASFRPRTA